jgi:sigma-B regulation protein RsbU (phosphoserine phosphatase)
MKLQTKVGFCVILVSMGLTGLISSVMTLVVGKNVNTAEQNLASEYANFVQSTFRQKQTTLSEYMYDWSAWDDLYNYAQQPNAAFATSNLNDGSLRTLKLHYMGVFNAEKQPLYERSLDEMRGRGVPLPPLHDHLHPQFFTPHTPDLTPKITLVNLPEGVMTVVWQPIISSQHDGRVQGTLVWGRYINAEYLQEISTTLGFTVTAASIKSPPMLWGISSRTPTDMEVFTDLMDGTGQPVLRLEMEVPRLVWQKSQRFLQTLVLGLLGSGITLALALYFLTARLLVSRLQRLDREVWNLQHMEDLQGRVTAAGNDELHRLASSINVLLEALQKREAEIVHLNARLSAENRSMETKLAIARRLQQALLPMATEIETAAAFGLDIAGYMLPADAVGGDYYDVLVGNSAVRLAIGDVTGHGVESGIVSIMVQTAIRTMQEMGENDPRRFLQVLNQVLYKNSQRLQEDKNLTLTVLEYEAGSLRLFGQHEDVVIVRNNGDVEFIDTRDLGFPLGLVEDIEEWVKVCSLSLFPGDVVVLYSDGITEAENAQKECFGLRRLVALVQLHRQENVATICAQVIQALEQYVGAMPLDDDVTLLILKQKGEGLNYSPFNIRDTFITQG